MDGGKKTSGNKVLVIILGFLGVAIVGLIVGIVIVNLNNQQNSNEEKTYNCSPDTVVNFDLTSEESAENEEFSEMFKSLTKEVDELFNANPVDLDAIIALYEPEIQKYINKNDYRKVALLISSRTGQLVTRGYGQNALDILTSIDFSVFSGIEQYRQYDQIIQIAKDLGKDEVVRKYEALIASVQEVYDESESTRLKLLEEQKAMEKYCSGRGE